MADGSFSLPSTTVHKDFVFHLAPLLSMATGTLMDDQLQMKRMDEFSQKEWLKKTSINVSKVMYQKEILHCWEIRSMDDSATTDEDSSLQDGESADRSSKKPSTSGNIMHLKNSMREITGKNSLKFKSKKSWVEAEIGRTLDSIQSYMEETQTVKLHNNGDFMRKHQKLIMRLIHGEIMLGINICILFSSYTLSLCISFVALLDERHRDKLVTVHDRLTRKEIDGRNSINKEDDIWQCISDLFNDPLWVPISHIFSKLQFCHEIALSCQIILTL
jgi:hypothetical protein